MLAELVFDCCLLAWNVVSRIGTRPLSEALLDWSMVLRKGSVGKDRKQY